MDEMTEQEKKQYEKEQQEKLKEEIHKKIIKQYSITDQLNTIRRVLLKITKDKDLQEMTEYIDNLLTVNKNVISDDK
jgi:hypothetical protein